MGNNGNALRVLSIYVVLLIVGQAVSVGVGLLLDPISKTAALATFIPLYYAMYWVAWRLALRIADRSPSPQQQASSSAGSPIAIWLLAPALLAIDTAE